MPARSVVVQLQNGVGQAILPDHRKMLPGVQYVIDWDTFEKISNGARQNVIQVVSINNDSSNLPSTFVPAQTQTGSNNFLNIQSALTTTSTTPFSWQAAGFAAQGVDGNGAVGVGPTTYVELGSALIGPANERYEYVFNGGATVASGGVAVWLDENNRVITNNRPAYNVFVDGQGTQFVQSVNVTGALISGQVSIGTKQGRFAGVPVVTIASGYFGWIQTEGFCPYLTVSGAVTAGATLAVGGAGVAVSQAGGSEVITGITVSGTALSNNVFGTALTAATNGALTADLRSVSSKIKYKRFLNKN